VTDIQWDRKEKRQVTKGKTRISRDRKTQRNEGREEGKKKEE
jgi:hypothetical protein